MTQSDHAELARVYDLGLAARRATIAAYDAAQARRQARIAYYDAKRAPRSVA